MEHAKKMILVDPRQIDIHQEYKELQKPTLAKQQALHSLDLKRLLQEDGDGIPDDLKVMKYRQILSKLLNISEVVPSTLPLVPSATAAAAPAAAPETKRRGRARTRKQTASVKPAIKETRPTSEHVLRTRAGKKPKVSTPSWASNWKLYWGAESDIEPHITWQTY